MSVIDALEVKIHELEKELQATKEQFNKSISLLRDLIFDETDRSMIDAEKFLEQLKQKDEVKGEK